jgi:hypothetical protein
MEYTGRMANRVATWSFKSSWPRASVRPISVGADALKDVPLFVMDRAANAGEADDWLWSYAPFFRPPFQAVLVPYGTGSAEGALLRLSVTHMFSDGFSVVPLLRDLAYYYAQAEAVEAASASTTVDNACLSSLVALPALPDVLPALQPRLLRTIEGAPADAVDFLGVGVTGGITLEPAVKDRAPEGHSILATLPAPVVEEIRRAATALAVPEDIAMLAVIGVALCRFEGTRTVTIAMIVPQRDGPAESDMVGLFADIRHLTVCTDGMGMAGVALRLHHIVGERQWRAPGLATQFDLPFVNFEWTDFEEENGFSQHVQIREYPELARHPITCRVVQPDRDTWRMNTVFSDFVYDAARREAFHSMFEESLRALIECPLSAVWPEEG